MDIYFVGIKILGESIGQLVIPKCRRTEVLKLAHTSVFSSHMGPKKTLERIKYSFFWEGLRADVKKFCESCKECQLTRSVRIKDRSSSTPVARPELPFEVGNMDLIGPIDPPSLKGHKYILRLVDQHTRWGEAVPLTSLSAKVTCEAWLNIFSRTEIYLLSKREGGACKEPLPAPGNSRTRDDKRKGSSNDGGEKGRNGRRERVTKKARVVKSRHGWTMYLNLVTSQYILYFKKCPIEDVE
ncbi:retrovirus-related Pol polyprotein from transposon opus [Trichonephila clavipes]|nr:retrovirus-related Pol polyprotein from transposon opus [Trichonephila clavipes]